MFHVFLCSVFWSFAIASANALPIGAMILAQP